MPRSARISAGGYIYHVINRGNGKAQVFHEDQDYAAFQTLMNKAGERIPMRILAYCLMPNHFHLVLWPHEDGDLGRWMRWLLTTHANGHHRKYGTSGHIWQGRFKSFVTQDDEHLYQVLRYVERNPVRANLVRSATAWNWSSHGPGALAVELTDWPVPRPRDWRARVDAAEIPAELEALRAAANRQTALGSQSWISTAEKALGVSLQPRPRGRPARKTEK